MATHVGIPPELEGLLRESLRAFGDRVTLVHAPFSRLRTVLERAAYLDAQPEVDGSILILWFRYGFHPVQLHPALSARRQGRSIRPDVPSRRVGRARSCRSLAWPRL